MADPRILTDDQYRQAVDDHEEFTAMLREPIGFTAKPNVVMVGSDGVYHPMYRSIYGPKTQRRFIENWKGFAARAAKRLNEHHEAGGVAPREGG